MIYGINKYKTIKNFDYDSDDEMLFTAETSIYLYQPEYLLWKLEERAV